MGGIEMSYASEYATNAYMRLGSLVHWGYDLRIHELTVTYLEGDEEYALVDDDDVIIIQSDFIGDCIEWAHKFYVGGRNEHVSVDGKLRSYNEFYK
jgi:hypothetical protein